ncbi:hypothetical protein VMT65_02675 [Nocardia sp. CDC153]|uniref:hypothetical protein n=1 Tax=Nocardia sp. CDC153 TaxID=3112167 RepID=UPI002DB74B2B|nr:hypothetical protein [Nocardia sp. CDC153]MEC3951929.1 hypothetical protein [Nocardia sp. CDC153]
MHARKLVTGLGALAAAATLAVGTAQADAPLTINTAAASNGDAVVNISYQCAPGLGAELSVTLLATPYVAPGVNGPGVNGTALAPAVCTGGPQQATVTVNPVQIFGEPAEFQSGSPTDITVTVLALTPNSPVTTIRKHIPHLG